MTPIYLLKSYHKINSYFPLFLFVLIPGNRELKVTGIGHTVGTDGSQFRQRQMMPEQLGNPSSCISFEINRESNSSWNNTNLFGSYSQLTHESLDVKCSFMRDDQEITVRIVKRRLLHWCICTVNIDWDPLFERWLSGSHDWYQTLDEVDLAFLDLWDGLPSQLVGIMANVLFAQIAFDDSEGVVGWLVLALSNRRTDFVQPDLLIFSSLDCESGACQLFSENSMLEFYGTVLI